MNKHTQHDSRTGSISRRQAIKTAAAGLAGFTIVPRHVLGGAGQTAPSEKLNIAGIGFGGVGKSFLADCAGENIMALCDVDHEYARKVFERYPDAKRYIDYREMFDSEPEIDAVIIGTPDHTHAVITMEAIRRGKHVMCVKPLTRTIHEARTVTEAARKAGIATQVTASSRTANSALELCETIWDGAIGDVHEVHCWSNRPLWPQGMLRPEGEDPIPATLDWDLWIGPAEMRPFKDKWPEGDLALRMVGARNQRGVYHPWNFRGWWDFGTGSLGDMGCHHFNTLFRALKLKHPTTIEASSTRVFPETVPLACKVTFEFPAREGMPPVRLVWHDGGLKPPIPEELGNEALENMGNLYIGTKGKILGNTNRGKIIPEEKAKKYGKPPEKLERVPYNDNIASLEWIDACKGGRTASCNFDVAGLLTEAVLLGNIAVRTGKKLHWDAEKMEFTNDESANKYIKEVYRSGWSLEA